MIYKDLLVHPDSIFGNEQVHVNILRVCRQTYIEARSLLWKNTFLIRLLFDEESRGHLLFMGRPFIFQLNGMTSSLDAWHHEYRLPIEEFFPLFQHIRNFDITILAESKASNFIRFSTVSLCWTTAELVASLAHVPTIEHLHVRLELDIPANNHGRDQTAPLKRILAKFEQLRNIRRFSLELPSLMQKYVLDPDGKITSNEAPPLHLLPEYKRLAGLIAKVMTHDTNSLWRYAEYLYMATLFGDRGWFARSAERLRPLLDTLLRGATAQEFLESHPWAERYSWGLGLLFDKALVDEDVLDTAFYLGALPASPLDRPLDCKL
jgi:hypothetical protein